MTTNFDGFCTPCAALVEILPMFLRNSCAKNAANKSAHITQIQQGFGRVCACGFLLYPGLTPYFFTIFFTPCSG